MLSCEHYDILELCCVYQLALRLHQKSGGYTQGVASTLLHNAEGEECIEILLSARIDHFRRQVKLADIASIEALVKNPHLDKVEFNSAQAS